MWDYPRPPRLEPATSTIRVEHGGVVIAESTRALRVLETSQPPAYYLPPGDVALDHLRESTTTTYCEWKGVATYADVAVGDLVAPRAAWWYASPTADFAELTDHIAFYAQVLDGCWVDDERVDSNEGSFYGGWITSKVVGPFKGGPGSTGW
ncbi:DUF427 domain-containing protein [soil metagenome]